MGNFLSSNKINEIFDKPYKQSFLITGIDESGKSTILKGINSNKYVERVVPAIGFYYQTIKIKNTVLTSFNVGNGICFGNFKKATKPLFKDCNGIIFVIDSNDQKRFEEIKKHLETIRNDEDLLKKPIIFFMNKQDLPNTLSPERISTILELHNIKERRWYIQITNGFTLEGVYEGIERLSLAVDISSGLIEIE